MDKQSILTSLKNEKQYLQTTFGVEEIALFGSYARGDARSESDIDILVSLQKPSYSSIMGLYTYLENKLSAKIDIIRKGPHLSNRFLKIIQKDIIYV